MAAFCSSKRRLKLFLSLLFFYSMSSLRLTVSSVSLNLIHLEQAFFQNPDDGQVGVKWSTNTNLGFKCRIRFRGSFCFNQGENRRDSSAIPRIVNAE